MIYHLPLDPRSASTGDHFMIPKAGTAPAHCAGYARTNRLRFSGDHNFFQIGMFLLPRHFFWVQAFDDYSSFLRAPELTFQLGSGACSDSPHYLGA